MCESSFCCSRAGAFLWAIFILYKCLTLCWGGDVFGKLCSGRSSVLVDWSTFLLKTAGVYECVALGENLIISIVSFHLVQIFSHSYQKLLCFYVEKVILQENKYHTLTVQVFFQSDVYILYISFVYLNWTVKRCWFLCKNHKRINYKYMNKLFKWYLRWRDVVVEGRKVTPDSATEASAHT